MRRHVSVLVPPIASLSIAAWSIVPAIGGNSDRLDVLIRSGLVADGTGAALVKADVGVRDGRIVSVGPGLPAEAETIVDATGLVVAPGFIDVHTHADNLAEHPVAENFVRMGVTTVVAGNCGGSAVDVAARFREIEDVGSAVNFATLIGHGSVRQSIMGTARRAPTAGELARMRASVARAMADGALGLSTGLEYVPGTYAARDEILTLAREAATAGGIYVSHMRNEGTDVEAAAAETIDIGESAQCPVQISHLKIDSPSRWGRSEQVLALIARARTRGVAVGADVYAYAASSTGLAVRFPSWALEGGQARIDARLADAKTWAAIKAEMTRTLASRGFKDLAFAAVASFPADPSLNGLTIADIARRQGDASFDGQLEAARRMMQAGGAQMVYHAMSDDDVVRILQAPAVAVASDAYLAEPGRGAPHPRSYGNAARVLAHYVRERRVLALEDAIRKMTWLPAQHFKLPERGRLAPGYVADVVVFDPRKVDAPASFAQPHQYATGIPQVLVHGTFVVRDGAMTDLRPGRILRHAKP
jgi:N-acyl-D-aspartate/D-glutamate deacylase